MDTERERNDIDEATAEEDAAAPLGPMARLVEAARGSGVGTEDPNIVGDVGPTDVPPGRDPEATILPGVVVDTGETPTSRAD